MEGELTHWEGEPTQVWEALWEVPRFEAFSTLSSTNDRLKAMAAEGAFPYTVVTAEHQTRGRGRSGRVWSSPEGLGLWLSVLLVAECREDRVRMPLLLGLAVARTVASVVPDLEPRIKWPNDVQVGGRKVCGVLCEAAGSREVVAGVGINVRQKASDFPFEIRDRAVSLEEASGRRVSRSTLVGALLGEIRGLFREGVPWLCGSLALEFRRRDALYGLRVRASAGCQGVAAGVDSSGALLVDVGDSVVRVACGSARVEEERLPPDVSQPNPSE